jgi:hypothetical protein
MGLASTAGVRTLAPTALSTMKRIELALLLTCFCLLFTACEHNEFPDPVVYDEPSGYIMAGETGDRVHVWELGNFCYIGGWSAPQTFEQSLEPWCGGRLIFGAFSSSHHAGGYGSSSIGALDSLLEFAVTTIVDSFWVCYNLNPDSSSGTIHYSNGMTAASCSGQRYFDYVDSIHSPTPIDAGTRLDASLTWKKGGGYCYLESYQFTQGPVEYHWYKGYKPWEEYYSRQFVGFRYPRTGGYQYGYAEVIVNENTMSIYRIGLER